MDFEQITKRLEWLDDQERKSKSSVSEITKTLASLETTVNALSKQFKTLSKDVGVLGPVTARLDQFDQLLSKQRAEWGKALESIEKTTGQRERETLKQRQAEMADVKASIEELRASLEFEPIKKQLKEQALDDKRLSLDIQDLQQKVDAVAQPIESSLNIAKEANEAHRQNLKQITDLQAEMVAVRKRADEAREKTLIYGDSIRNLENRMTELVESEAARKQAQTVFLDQQVLAQVERDRGWKEWQAKYENFKKQAENMELQVVALDDSIRAAKRSQEAYTELNQKLERRIAEISEIQRLAEDRIRQEWVAFKADEQKRWTSHALSQEEVMRDLRKDLDKMEGHVTQLDDSSQVLQDQLHQTTSTTEQQLQELMNVSHEWLTAYERIMGHAKTKTKKAK